jgi:hypothetical protein
MVHDLPASGQHSLPPDPKGTAGVFRRVGYRLEDALADIIDNSIDAGAKTVLVRIVRAKSSLIRILIVDDGCGMTEQKLDGVMQYGVQENHLKGDLGKYGIGLKSASFSQCASLTVISRKLGETSGRRWTLTSIAANWTVEIVQSDAAVRFYDQKWHPLLNGNSGTIVVWDELEIGFSPGPDFEKNVSGLLKEISNGLGLRFHRFIQRNQTKFFLDVQMNTSGERFAPIPIQLMDPFGYVKSGQKGFPADFLLDVEGLGRLKLRAHIWPAKSKDPNYKLGGGNVAGRQGFYFYRNDRLIQEGGWNKFQKSDHEPHLSLARVEIDLPPEFDSAFKLTIQKDQIEPPRTFLHALSEAYSGPMSFSKYLEVANDTYRNAEPDEESQFFVPGAGIPSMASKRIEKRFADLWEGKPVEISFEWVNLGADAFFDVDRERRLIRLNRLYRDIITGGINSKTDASLVKILLFFLCEQALTKQRLSGVQRERLDLLNDALLDVLRTIK